MSKWRPSKKCLYVIPDIHGQYHQLQLILSRILPLRKTDGVKDRIVFLGDYVDRRVDSHKVLDTVIELKEKWDDQVITLKGNHEIMFLNAMKPSSNSDDYRFWMQYGGVETLQGYIQRSGVLAEKSSFKDPHAKNEEDSLNYSSDELANPYTLARQRIKDFVPQEHKEFMRSCQTYYETDDFIFVHGGCEPFTPLEQQDPNVFIWDRSLYNAVCGIDGEPRFRWDKCIVTGHNGDTGEPYINPKFMMLDVSCASKLLVLEVNSMEGFVAKKGKKRLVKLQY